MSKNGMPLWREAHLQVKMHKAPRARTNFGRSDVQKWHAAVARSKFVSQNAPNTSARDQFWQFRSGKIARRCGEKCIFESKWAKHNMFGSLFEGQRCPKNARRCGAKRICKSKCTKHKTPAFCSFLRGF